MNKRIEIEIQGMGIAFHSGGILNEKEEGYDFLDKEFWNPDDVEKHVKKCDITAFCTGSPGKYNLIFSKGSARQKEINRSAAYLHLGVIINDQKMYIRDLYELDDWTSNDEALIRIELENGIYEMDLLVNRISDRKFFKSGQDVYVYLQKVEKLPQIEISGVPMLLYE